MGILIQCEANNIVRTIKRFCGGNQNESNRQAQDGECGDEAFSAV